MKFHQQSHSLRLAILCVGLVACTEASPVAQAKVESAKDVSTSGVDAAKTADSQAQARPAQAAAVDSRSRDAQPAYELKDAPLEPHCAELLEIAFGAATAMPVKPHIKTRSRLQEDVVDACLELAQPKRALGYIEQIENWRRGAAYADLAFHCAEHGGYGPEVDKFLDNAMVESEAPEDEIGQAWRADRIKGKIARTHVLLGNKEQAAMFAHGIEEAEARKVAAFEAGSLPEEKFETTLAALDHGALEVGEYEMVVYALEASKQLYDRFYDDAAKRDLLEERIQRYWLKAPFGYRVDTLIAFTDAALSHGDREKAAALTTQTVELIKSSIWTPADFSEVMGQLAALHQRAGDPESAQRCVADALAKFDRERDTIWNFERAEALTPIAEAQHVLGDDAGALATYRRAVDDGAENPNARPRAEDLVATCLSMAKSGVKPGDELLARIREVRAGLSDPW